MKAVRIHQDGGPEVLVYEDAPGPERRDGEVLVELRAASLNHLDLWVRKGLPSVPKPRILGADGLDHGGGRIGVIGEHCDGTHAELVAVPAGNVYPLPDEISSEDAAAFPLVFETAEGHGADVVVEHVGEPTWRARPVVDSVYPPAEARAAHERLEAGEQLGKVVLRIPG